VRRPQLSLINELSRYAELPGEHLLILGYPLAPQAYQLCFTLAALVEPSCKSEGEIRDVRAMAALALARAGDTAGAEKLTAEQRFSNA
jgi:hypothetical protein